MDTSGIERVIDVDFDTSSVMDLDISVVVDGINSSLIESQIVEYEDILNINDYSAEATHEKSYASSAYASKKIHDSLSTLKSDVNLITGDINNLDSRVKSLERYGTGGGSGEGVGCLWTENEGTLETDKNVYINGNLVVTGDISAS